MRPIVYTTPGGAHTGSALPLDIHGRPEVTLQADVTGTANYTIQQTLDDVFDAAVTPTWFDHPDTNRVAQTVDRQGSYSNVFRAVRITQASGAGTVKLTIVQAGDNRA